MKRQEEVSKAEEEKKQEEADKAEDCLWKSFQSIFQGLHWIIEIIKFMIINGFRYSWEYNYLKDSAELKDYILVVIIMSNLGLDIVAKGKVINLVNTKL